MKIFVSLFAALLGFCFAQLEGQYQSEAEQGTALLIVRQNGEQVSGTLSGSATGSFEGSWDGQVATGLMTIMIDGSSLTLVFGMEPSANGLILALADIDPVTQEAKMDTLTSFEYQRVAQANTNPLKPTPQESQNASNPLAQGAKFAGDFANENLELSLRPAANGYEGTLTVSGQSFMVFAQEQAGQLFGSFGEGFSFSASLQGEILSLSSDGATYQLQRQTTNASANPLANTNTTPPAGSEIQANRQYLSGETLNSSVSGVSFTIPQGFTGIYEASEQIFAMIAQDQSSLIVVEAASNATAEELASALLDTVAASFGDDVQASLVAGPNQQGDSLTITYLVNGNTLHAAARQGTSGNSIVFVGYSASASISQTIDHLLGSSTLTTPQADNNNLALGGTDFYSNRSDSYFSPGGVGDGSMAGQTERYYSFCSDGNYGFQYSSETFMSVEGAGSLSSRDSDAHQGHWRLTRTLMGHMALILEASDGRFFTPKLEQVAEGFVIDGYLFQASISQQCN